MDEISRGSVPDDPGQGVVTKDLDRVPAALRDRAGLAGAEVAAPDRTVPDLDTTAEDTIAEDTDRELLPMTSPEKKPRKKAKKKRATPKRAKQAAPPTDASIPDEIEAKTDAKTDAKTEAGSEVVAAAEVPAGETPTDEILVEDAPATAVPADLEDDGTAAAPPEGELSRVLCALLLSSREALTMLRLSQSTHTTPKAVKKALDVLRQTLESSGLPMELSITGEQVRLLTTPDVFGYLSNLRSVKKQEKLSAAALETLAVVAYRQPVIRAEIEAIRGVKAGPILRTLLDHRMVKITGRADVPGRPLQYGTTQHFLETFGLESLKDLPSVKEFRAL